MSSSGPGALGELCRLVASGLGALSETLLEVLGAPAGLSGGCECESTSRTLGCAGDSCPAALVLHESILGFVAKVCGCRKRCSGCGEAQASLRSVAMLLEDALFC